MPTHGARKPTQLTPVPLKSSVARVPTAKPRAAVPPLHGRLVLPCVQAPKYVTAVLLSSMRIVRFATVTVTAAESAGLPAPSRATAVSGCDPLLAAVVSHDMEYGAVVASAPRGTPSRR